MTSEWWNDFWMTEWLKNDRMTLEWQDDFRMIPSHLRMTENDGMIQEWCRIILLGIWLDQKCHGMRLDLTLR